MIKPEMVPDEAYEAWHAAFFSDEGGRAAIAAALNAWPGMERHTFPESGLGDDYTPPIDEVFLPLAQKQEDGDE